MQENSKNLTGWVYSLGGLRKRSKGSDFSEERKKKEFGTCIAQLIKNTIFLR